MRAAIRLTQPKYASLPGPSKICATCANLIRPPAALSAAAYTRSTRLIDTVTLSLPTPWHKANPHDNRPCYTEASVDWIFIGRTVFGGQAALFSFVTYPRSGSKQQVVATGSAMFPLVTALTVASERGLEDDFAREYKWPASSSRSSASWVVRLKADAAHHGQLEDVISTVEWQRRCLRSSREPRPLVRHDLGIWRTRHDSNVWPSPSEGDALSS